MTTPNLAPGAIASGWHQDTRIRMDTFVTIAVHGTPDVAIERVERAFAWFAQVEITCSRFDPASELVRLMPGQPIQVSPLLFELLRIACDLADASDGAFDPTIGASMADRGFNQHYQTGEIVKPTAVSTANYRDIHLDPITRTVTLARPLALDLNAIAKGMAVDLAAQELADFPSGCVNAGGDLIVWGTNDLGLPWQIGIKNPAQPDAILHRVALSHGAACTSGNYERVSASGEGHLVSSSSSPTDLASVTVFASNAVLADGAATAAFALGFERGRAFLEDQGLEAVFIKNPDLAVDVLRVPGGVL